MRLILALLLAVPGMLLLATPALPLGVALVWAAWWVYERSRLPERDELAGLVMTMGALGALAVIIQFATQRI